MHCRSRMLSVDILHFVTVVLLALFITPVVILVSIFLFYLFFNRSISQPACMQWLIMTMIQLNTIPGGKLLRKHILTGDVLFAVWLPSLHSIWRTSVSLALSLCILTWIIPHGLNVTNATPHTIYSVAPENPCKLSEINISFVHFFAADSFRPFILCVSVDLPPRFNVCSFRLCCVLLALKMARKKLCPGTPKKKKKTPLLHHTCHKE